MRQHSHRVLSEYRITPPQWAILFAASYYLPAPVDQFVIEAQLESEENFSTDELSTALDDCLRAGWICGADQTRIQEMSEDCEAFSIDHLENGIVLTDTGTVLKERVSQALLETVEID